MAAGSARWRRGEGVRADAQAAKDAAAQAFYELDTVQRDARLSVDTVAAADNSPGARRAIADFATLGTRIDEVSAAYISALDAHDLEAEDLDQMIAARNARRRARGEPEVTAAEYELRVTSDIHEHNRRREQSLADRELDQLLEATNAQRRKRGRPERTREQAREEFGGKPPAES